MSIRIESASHDPVMVYVVMLDITDLFMCGPNLVSIYFDPTTV